MQFAGVSWFVGNAWIPGLQPTSWFSDLLTASVPASASATVFRRTMSADIGRAGTRIHDA